MSDDKAREAARGMTNEYLVDLALQLYSRATSPSCSQQVHERAMELKAELFSRLEAATRTQAGLREHDAEYTKKWYEEKKLRVALETDVASLKYAREREAGTIQTLRERCEKLEAALRNFEWLTHKSGDPFCVVCNAWKKNGHTSACKLGLALAKPEPGGD